MKIFSHNIRKEPNPMTIGLTEKEIQSVSGGIANSIIGAAIVAGVAGYLYYELGLNEGWRFTKSVIIVSVCRVGVGFFFHQDLQGHPGIRAGVENTAAAFCIAAGCLYETFHSHNTTYPGSVYHYVNVTKT